MSPARDLGVPIPPKRCPPRVRRRANPLRVRVPEVEPVVIAAATLVLWYRARTADSRSGTRKTMIVALARKLIIALWRFVTTGEPLEGVVLRPAS